MPASYPQPANGDMFASGGSPDIRYKPTAFVCRETRKLAHVNGTTFAALIQELAAFSDGEAA